MIAKVEMIEADVREAIVDYINEKLSLVILKDKVTILVKSKQNYKSEWEEAAFKVSFSSTLHRVG